jgi:hypothetical protein
MAFFELGNLVYLVSDSPDENVGEFLGRAGRLERVPQRLQLGQLEKMVTRKQPLVSLVLEHGLADVETLRGWMKEYACEAFGHLFDSREGTVKVLPAISADHPAAFSIDALALVIEGARRMRNDLLVAEAIGPRNYMIRSSPGHTERLQRLPLGYVEGLLAAQIQGEISINDLITISGLPESEALRGLLGLRLAGVLGPFTEPQRLTDTGRLRLRQAAKESGVALDASSAAVVLGMMGQAGVAEDEDGPAPAAAITMGDFGAPPAPEPVPVPAAAASPVTTTPPRMRGDTARLKLLTSAYIQMAEAEAASGNYAAAAQCLESALAQRPDDLDTLIAYGAMLGKRPGGVPAAEKVLTRACEAHSESIKPRLALARLYREAARMSQAEEVLLEAKRLQPNNPEVRKLLEEVQGGGKGGFLKRLGIKSDVRKTPPRPAPPSSGSRSGVTPAPSDAEFGMRCRFCGQPCSAEARVCRRCGATL